MARQYSRHMFLRQTPRAILKEYFSNKGLLAGIVRLCLAKEPAEAAASPAAAPPNGPPGVLDKEEVEKFDRMSKKKIVDALANAIEQLPDAQRVAVEADFDLVNEMAYARGVEAILEEAAFRKLDWAGSFAGMSNHYERAFRAFLDQPDLFYVAGHLDDMDRVGSWERRPVDKNLIPGVEQADLTAFAAAISALYKPQGRGRYCTVKNYLRQDPERHCYFVHPEDHVVNEPSYASGGELKLVPRRPVFEIMLIYRPAEGILELSASGKKEHKEDIMGALCKTILGLPGLPDIDPGPDYDLSSLKKRETEFTTADEDAIEAVDVRLLCVNLPGGKSRRITFEANPSRKSPTAIHDLIDEALNVQNVPLDSVHVAKARLRLTFTPPNGGRKKTLTFEIALPNRCTLRDSKYDQIAKKYLRLWKIARESTS